MAFYNQITGFIRKNFFINFFHYLSFFVLSISFETKSNHIFGGHLGLKQLDKATGRFRITLQYYWDLERLADTSNVGLNNDDYRLVYIINKRTNTATGITLNYVGSKEVIYDNKACAELRKFVTREFTYGLDITLSPQDYSDVEGYVLAWDQCCRNGALSNLVNPSKTGFYYMVEIPSLFQNGKPIDFSSPDFPILNGDYICINKNFQYDFGATDRDGDELRYSLVSPLIGIVNDLTKPIVTNLQYSPVQFTTGIGVQNMIPGNPALKIDPKTGLITVKANQLGIFAFSVLVEKYRNGVKIGSVRHEFQFPVVDCSGKAPPIPVITYLGQPVNEVSICAGQTAILEVEDKPEWSFQWTKDFDNIAKATKNTITVSDTGSYAVIKSLARTCANDTISTPVKVRLKNFSEKLSIQLTKKSFCVGDSIILLAITNTTDTAGLVYSWQKEQTLIKKAKSITIKEAGFFKLKGERSTGGCGIVPDSVQISTFPLPILTAPQSFTICPTDQVELETVQNFAWTYEWKLGNNILGKLYKQNVNQEGDYYIKVTDANGCIAIAGPYIVKFKSDCPISDSSRLYIPQIFTPNNDGINDKWIIQNLEKYPEAIITIYNRWGEVVFYATGSNASWDGMYKGQKLLTDTYAYKIFTRVFTYTGVVVLAE